MATQRITVATIIGEAGKAVIELFSEWRAAQGAQQQEAARHEVDRFAKQLRANGGVLPIVYFCEWFDHWLMGNSIHGSESVDGSQFEASCGSDIEAMGCADQCGDQFPEQRWLAARLREAAEGRQPFSEPAVVVMLREVVGGSATDEEVAASRQGVPEWLRLCRSSG